MGAADGRRARRRRGRPAAGRGAPLRDRRARRRLRPRARPRRRRDDARRPAPGRAARRARAGRQPRPPGLSHRGRRRAPGGGPRGARRRAPTRVEERFMLRAHVGPGRPRAEHVAFNDVVLSRVPGRGQALLALHVDGQLLVRYASDGVIAATPAGSTAYSYAAGGPIVSPQTRAMIVTPDAPHGLFNRAVVLGAEESLGVEVLANSAPVAVEVDGRLLAEAEPGWSRRHHPEPVAGARRAARLGRLRRARTAQARDHRPRRAGQLRLRRARALSRVARGRPLRGASARAARDARGRRCGRRSRRRRPVPHALERLVEVVGLEAISKTPTRRAPTSAPGRAAASCSRAWASRGESRAGAASRRCRCAIATMLAG